MLAALAAGPAAAHERPPAEEVYIQGDFTPRFTPPAPGTYELPVIKRIGSFPVLEGRQALRTQALLAGKIGVVSFIYTACSETLGCPLASEAMRQIQRHVAREGLRERVVLLSVSFDDVLDRASQLDAYARRWGADRSLWHFVRAPSEQSLEAMLAGFGQDRTRLYDDHGRFTGRYRHTLKVFLVDQRGAVRNIYSTGFLVPQVVINDIKTVLNERGPDRLSPEEPR
jgi:cytochrome oxidase Cu insertion factor (SCO1/SenC/PrrC family)